MQALQESLTREENQQRELSATKHKAYTDPLTGVKSKTAYLEVTESYKCHMIAGDALEFATVVFDVNDLKRVNDVEGHEAGDRHIISACGMICDVFKHSPIFRIGGDEFVAILEGKDYRNRDTLMLAFNQLVGENLRNGG
ncbi:MAG: GGDEF domain-containing protein [Oscillibacter sp.]|nr:GGDEF domain-containing protein [Oscillibacter sp.]